MYSIDFQRFKPSDRSPTRLEELEEARGELLQISEAEGQCVAAFEWGAVSLPLEIRDELAGMVGQKIAILRLDGYHCRAVV